MFVLKVVSPKWWRRWLRLRALVVLAALLTAPSVYVGWETRQIQRTTRASVTWATQTYSRAMRGVFTDTINRMTPSTTTSTTRP